MSRSSGMVYPSARSKVILDLIFGSSWDLGGQPRFRSMWERYCRGVNAIVYAIHARV